jgi:GNAT superfamily N-acetyltransferase
MGARHLLRADVASAAQCLARAFVDDPIQQWLAGSERAGDPAERMTKGFFAPAVEAGLGRGHAYGVPGETGFDAVAIWSPPDVPMLDESDEVALGTAFSASYGEEAIGRLIGLGALTGELDPSRPHFYLFIIGSSAQGRGTGGEAIAPVLGRCDAEGLGAYLESSNSRNLGFYQRLGFEVVWEERPAPDAPLTSGLWRDPRWPRRSAEDRRWARLPWASALTRRAKHPRPRSIGSGPGLGSRRPRTHVPASDPP